MEECTFSGLKIKIGKFRMRFWKYGFEYQWGPKGRVIFYPWATLKTFKFKEQSNGEGDKG